MQEIGKPHCFTCHKEHDLYHCVPSNPTPCTKECGKWFRELIINEWENEFNKLLENKLLPFPCQECGLGQNKETDNFMKLFIRKIRAEAKDEARKEVVEEMKKIINESVEEATKEHGSPNVYIDMVGETLSEKLLAFLSENKQP